MLARVESPKLYAMCLWDIDDHDPRYIMIACYDAEPWGRDGRLELARQRAMEKMEDCLFTSMRKGV